MLTYMQRRKGGTYWFRKKLPLELAGRDAPHHIRHAFPQFVNSQTGRFKREITGSLGTKDQATAKRRNLLRSRLVNEALLDLQRSLKAPCDLALADLPLPEDVEAEHFRSLLEADFAVRISGSLAPDAAKPARGMSEADHSAYGQGLEADRSNYRAALSRADASVVTAEAESLFQRVGLQYDPEDRRHYETALALLQACARAAEAKLARQRGEVVPTPKPLTSSRGPKLSEALARWQEGSSIRGGRQIAPNTKREAKLAVRLFTEWHGNKRLGAITKDDVRSFRGALERRPTRLSAKLRALPLRELLRAHLANFPPPHANTVNRLLTMLKAIVSHAEREGLTDDLPAFANPFKSVRSTVDQRQELNREPFAAEDLRAIFESPVFASGHRPAGGAGEAAFWLPVLALLTGARLEELAQLRVSDLRRDPEADTWFLDIGTSGGRTVKTASSRRRVPLHPELERIGLLRYRDLRLGAGPEAPLWPDIRSDLSGKRSPPWSKWFGRYLRKTANVTDPAKVFHSFRHTFKRLARDAGLSEELHDALTGHACGGGVGRGYGMGFGLKALAREIAKIEVPRPLTDLRWGPTPCRGGKHKDVAAEGTHHSYG
jgi:integrase